MAQNKAAFEVVGQINQKGLKATTPSFYKQADYSRTIYSNLKFNSRIYSSI
jgi:hypothetical protein